MVGAVAAYSSGAAFLAVTEMRYARWLRRKWQQRVSPEILSEILKHAELLNVPAQWREATVLVADLRGSTVLSEKLPPERFAECVNGFLEMVTEAVRRHRGTVFKFIGDGVMAVFGAPLDDPEHEANAVRAALEVARSCRRLPEEVLEGEGLPVRVGVHSGPLVAGDIGPPHMLEYTVMGETVNAAFRLQDLNKELGSQVAISEAVYRRLPEELRRNFRPAGERQLRGLSRPVAVHVAGGDAGREGGKPGTVGEQR